MFSPRLWSLDFGVSNRPQQYRKFFDESDLADAKAFENAFQEIKIGDRSFRINETWFIYVQKKDVDADASASFSIKERHNVAAALDAMQNDGFAIRDLINVDNMADAYSSFRVCAYDAMGLREGEHVKTDDRAEYRMIYERSFENWVEHMATADGCNARHYDDRVIEEVIAQAADVFYPDVLNILKRREYRKDMTTRTSHPQFMGWIKSRKGNCILAGRLADASRIPVDRSIQAAQNLD